MPTRQSRLVRLPQTAAATLDKLQQALEDRRGVVLNKGQVIGEALSYYLRQVSRTRRP